MALKDCGKCGEKVDEAKAFCPGCGHALVEERERTDSTSFDQADMTMHLGQTMYNQMLTDMGLNISKAPDSGNSRTNETKAIEVDPGPPAETAPKASSKKFWIVTIAVAAALFFLVLIALGAAGFIVYMSGAKS